MKTTVFLRKTIENTNKWKDILCLWIEQLDIKMKLLPKTIYGFSANSIKILKTFFAKIA